MKRTLLTISVICVLTTAQAQVILADGANNIIGNYNNITAANAAIPSTLTHPYIIELTDLYQSSLETFPIIFSSRAGASSINTITIRPHFVNLVPLTISGNVSGAGLVQLADADHIIIDGRIAGVGTMKGLNLQNSATASNSAVVAMMNGASNNVIRYCTITGFTSGTSTSRGVHIADILATSTSGNDNNTIEHSTLTGSRTLVNIVSASSAAFFNKGTKVYGCELLNPNFAAIWIGFGTSNVTIDSNIIYSTIASTSTSTGCWGILSDGHTDTTIITRNNIYNIISNAAIPVKAINFRSHNANGTSYALVANNLISLMAPNTSTTLLSGIDFGSVGSNASTCDIHHNTIRLGGTSVSGTATTVVSACINKANTGSLTLNARNNIIVNERTGGAGLNVGSNFANITGTFNTDYSTYQITSGNIARLATVTLNSLASFQAAVAPNEVNSNTDVLQFVSATDAHLAAGSFGNPNLFGIALPNITTDIDGHTRGNPPYRGGDEPITVLPLELLSFSAAKDGQHAILTWTTAQERNIAGFDIERSDNSIDFIRKGEVKSAGGSFEQTYRFTDHEALRTSGNKLFRLRIKGTDGSSYYSPVAVISDGTPSVTNGLFVYPNPGKGNYQVVVHGSEAAQAYLQVTDAQGKAVLHAAKHITPADRSFGISLPRNTPSGVYFIAVTVAGHTSVQKILKE